MPLIDIPGQLATIRIFHDEEELVIDHETLMQLDDVLVVEDLQGVGLAIDLLDRVCRFHYRT